MIKRIANLSIKRKLLLIVVFPSVVSLLVAGIFLLMLEMSEFQKNTRTYLSAVATIIANRSAAALVYDDKDLAKENLSMITKLPEVQAACLYNAKGEIFTDLLKTEQSTWTCPLSGNNLNTQFSDTHLWIIEPVMVDNDKQGTLYIHANFIATYWQKYNLLAYYFQYYSAYPY